MNLLPIEDGITHINVYSGARTSLGIFLSNFVTFPIETEDGDFESIEGYWYWLSIPESVTEREQLRKLSGLDAKKLGRALREEPNDASLSEEFQRKIKLATHDKVLNSSFKTQFAASKLPFTHYYVRAGEVIAAPGSEWQIAYLEELRVELQVEMNLMAFTAEERITK